LNDLIEIRPLAGIEFGMEQFAIGANFEGAVARRNQRKRLDALAQFENFGRQTDGLRRVVSNHAVFDRYLGFQRELLSEVKAIGAAKSGQEGGPERRLGARPFRVRQMPERLAETNFAWRKFEKAR